jgi:hypothetical protein
MGSLVWLWALAAWSAEPTIVVPQTKLEVGRPYVLFVEGIEKDELSADSLMLNPSDGLQAMGGYSWGGKPFVWIQPTKEGYYAIGVKALRDGKAIGCVAAIVVGKGGPGPDPPPPPPPPGVKTLVIIEEAKERYKLTPQQIQLLLSPTWRTWCRERKIQPRLSDDDIAITTPDLAASAKAARAAGLPSVVFLDADGKVIKVVPLPADTKAMMELLETRNG